MTLSFSTKWGKGMGELAGQPTHFVEKIWAGLIEKTSLNIGDYSNAHHDHVNRFGADMSDYDKMFITPKYHTIRHDPHNRWKAGNKIHFVINNRTKDRFQFAPVLQVKSVQKIEITDMIMTTNPAIWIPNDNGFGGRLITVEVDDKYLSEKEIETLAINDGFDSVNDFFRFFNTDFTGKIISWVDAKY